MKNHFNYTNRQRIPREQLRFAWVENGDGILRFTADLRLQLSETITPAAEVIVEAHSGPVVMRFPFGTLASISVPQETALIDFPPGLRPIFRVKVIDPGDGRRRIAARADDLTPLSPQEIQTGKRSIFPVETLDLGSVIWNVRMEGTKPILQLNSQIREPRDVTSLAKEADFIGLVYPAAINRVLNHLLLGPERDNVDGDHEWLLFGAALAGRHAPSEDDYEEDAPEYRDDVDQWIRDVVRGFCERQSVIESYVRFRKEAEEPNA